MTAADLLAQGRAAAEALMLDACTVTRPTGGPGPIDQQTGERGPAPTTTVYAGPCKIQTYEPHEAAREVGAHAYIEQRYHLHVPVAVSGIRPGDTATITTAVNDSRLVGRTYRVAGLHHKSWATAQRLLIDEITG